MDIADILGKIGFDWRMALANLINFLIIFWLLKRYAFQPIQRKLAERQSIIKQGMEDAESAKTERISAETNYERKLAEARDEAQKIIATAHEHSEEMTKKATADAQQQVERIVSDARAMIAKEKQHMESELQAKTAEIAIQVAEKILKQKIDTVADAQLIKEAIK